ncbi:AAA family ATPase [Pseudoclavibacter sp. CFCC 13796]|uniref:AAA family ATPase n=1 Tax=Pseudoclavibacter sp. CFCC 13796 TaxID=2615179 RepID=UPI001300DD40|nr:AAA family ATPase [Pseudoclavibacter sp. CFCC 13796]KAB1661612.1 AAA family ATPase [Pseudoclavibacter sp. CFCC 13796]
MSTHIGVVEVPGLVEPLTRAGFDVITGDEWKSAARAVRDARKLVGAFPIIIGDVSRPAIQAWVDATLSRRDSRILAIVDETVADRADLNSSSDLFTVMRTPVTVEQLLAWLQVGSDTGLHGTLEGLMTFVTSSPEPDVDPELADLFDLDAADTSASVALPTDETEADESGYDDFTPTPEPVQRSETPLAPPLPEPEPRAEPILPLPTPEQEPEVSKSAPEATDFPLPEPTRASDVQPEPLPEPQPAPVPQTPAPEAESTRSIIDELFSTAPAAPPSGEPLLPAAPHLMPAPERPPSASSDDFLAELFGSPSPEPVAPAAHAPEPSSDEPVLEEAEPVDVVPEPPAELFVPPVPLIVDGEIGPLPKDDRAVAEEESAETVRQHADAFDEATVVAPEVGHITPRDSLPRYPESSTPVVFTMAAKGGVTKTTTALSLAHRAATVYGKRVTVIDMNRGQGSICQMLRMDTERRLTDEGLPTVYDMAVTRRPEAALILPERASHFRPHELPPIPFALMLAPTDLLNDPLLVDDALYRTAIDYARTVSDLVIVDTQIIESTDVSGLVDNVMAPLVRERGAWAVGLFENNREAIANLKSRLESDFSGAPTGRVLLVTSLIHERSELETGLLSGIETRFQGLGQYLGATFYDAAFRDNLNIGLFDSSSPAVAEVTDKIVSRVLGEPPRLEASEVTPKREKRRGLFRRRR